MFEMEEVVSFGCRLLSGVDGLSSFRHEKLSFWYVKVIVRHTEFVILWVNTWFLSCQSQSQSHFTTSGLPPNSSSSRQPLETHDH
jgi:hypothetical protein